MNTAGGVLSGRPAHLFPLVRHLSWRVTPWLLRTPLTPNQITVISVAVSLAGAWLFLDGGYRTGVGGALCLDVGYVFDNCDGEVARRKNLCSRFGALLDTAGDGLIHAVFFVALGVGVAHAGGHALWAWLGWITAAGTAVNSFISLRREAGASDDDEALERPPAAAGALDWLLFALRELSRADFCFIVLALALAGGAWLLLPVAAIGAQVVWMTKFRKDANQYHV